MEIPRLFFCSEAEIIGANMPQPSTRGSLREALGRGSAEAMEGERERERVCVCVL